MAYNYPSACVGVPVDVRAEALYLRNEERDETTVCFITREDVVVPKGTVVRVPVDDLSASAARAIREHIQGGHPSTMDFQLKSKDFVEAVRTINAIIERDELRLQRIRAEAAAAKVRKVR
jgi:hypothetical protein